VNLGRAVAWALSIALVCVVLISAFLFRTDPGPAGQPMLVTYGLIGLCLAILLILTDVRFGVGIFTLMACLSPRFGENFRLEDLLVPVLLVIWLWRVIHGGRLVVRTPITLPFVAVALTMLLSFLWGLSIGTIPRPTYGFFVVAKRLEYACLFFIALNSIQSREAGRALLTTFLAGAVVASVIALGSATHDASVGDTRAMGLDEENYNTFAGFLCIAISLSVAGALHYRSRLGLVFGAAALLLITTLLKSYSREGYFILFVALLALGVMRYRVLIPLLLVAALLAPFVAPSTMLGRVNDAVGQVQNYQHADGGSNSMTARVNGWVWRWALVEQQPLLGNGPGSIQLQVDNEYLLRLVESGAIGLGAFLLLLFSFWRYFRICIRRLRGTESEPFVYGLTAAFVGMVLQGMVAAAWSTIRTMEPFWILSGAIGGLVVNRTYQVQAAAEAAKVEAAHGGV
jgi:O-antigen ligase